MACCDVSEKSTESILRETDWFSEDGGSQCGVILGSSANQSCGRGEDTNGWPGTRRRTLAEQGPRQF